MVNCKKITKSFILCVCVCFYNDHFFLPIKFNLKEEKKKVVKFSIFLFAIWTNFTPSNILQLFLLKKKKTKKQNKKNWWLFNIL